MFVWFEHIILSKQPLPLLLLLFYWHHLNSVGEKNQAETDCTRGHLGNQQLTIQHTNDRNYYYLTSSIFICLAAAYALCHQLLFYDRVCCLFCLFVKCIREYFCLSTGQFRQLVSQERNIYTVIAITMNFNQETWQFYLRYDSQFVGWWV